MHRMRELGFGRRLLATSLAVCTLFGAGLLARPARSNTRESVCELATLERDKVRSAQCLACHDGSIAGAVLHTSEGAPHPVEVHYELARLQSPAARLVPVGELNPLLVLSNGFVTCATCHNPKSPHPHHTALRMDRSAMCYGCHQL